ncbi:hypothetical protein NQ317_009434 [Molorchus minor]|uniref:Uncharacterized protein n=1 Tax=Molorchus minor TaxID=1323400 RepID=A0ABQ9JR66_9CUCU|nr:hypothetical protein NQ317_009434 [Molorchus minor]
MFYSCALPLVLKQKTVFDIPRQQNMLRKVVPFLTLMSDLAASDNRELSATVFASRKKLAAVVSISCRDAYIGNLQNWSTIVIVITTINVQKTFIFHFHYTNLPDFNSLKVNCYQNFEISSKNSIKYLGIIIDRHLIWDEHMRNVCHIKQLNIFFSLIQSHLKEWWGGCKYGCLTDSVMSVTFLYTNFQIPEFTARECFRRASTSYFVVELTYL